ncbi:hypothetical protein [Hyphobacterium sp.]|jgi:hypothetical protein|uniref:hypothetical protein n=1 Tax=Hyphobacterium sp. TaxID=2004662 RepID=UPI003BA85DA9
MKPSLPLALLAALALAACGNNSAGEGETSSTGSSSETPSGGGDAVQTSAGSGDDFAAACLNATNNSPEICECMAEQADDALTGDAREFLIASMNDENERVLAMRGELSVEEMSVAGMFLVNATVECTREGRQ